VVVEKKRIKQQEISKLAPVSICSIFNFIFIEDIFIIDKKNLERMNNESDTLNSYLFVLLVALVHLHERKKIYTMKIYIFIFIYYSLRIILNIQC